MDQSEARLRIPAGLVRRQKRLFRALDVALPKSNAAKLGQGPAELPSQVGSELVACLENLGLRLGAATAQAEDLGAMHAASPVETAHRLPVPPSLHLFRPLLGEVVLPEGLKRADHFAIDNPGPEGTDLTRDRRDRGFVEQRDASRDVPFEDKAARLRHAADRGGCRIAPGTQVDRPPRPVSRRGEVPRQQPFVIAHDGDPCVDGCLLRMPLEKSFGAREPSPDRGEERVSKSRCMATRTAAPAAATGSPASALVRWIRSHVSMVTSK